MGSKVLLRVTSLTPGYTGLIAANMNEPFPYCLLNYLNFMAFPVADFDGFTMSGSTVICILQRDSSLL